MPSDLLRRRPDIRKADADLHAATARIGVAMADLYPKISLSGSFGLQGAQASSLASRSQNFWSIGPSVTLPIFQDGAIKGNNEQQTALTEAAVANYKATILTALEEVESAMIAYDQQQQQQQRAMTLDQGVKASTDAVRLSMQLYEAGKTDFINVLNAQLSLFNAQSSQLDSRQLALTSLVSLYKALGGGWTILSNSK